MGAHIDLANWIAEVLPRMHFHTCGCGYRGDCYEEECQTLDEEEVGYECHTCLVGPSEDEDEYAEMNDRAKKLMKELGDVVFDWDEVDYDCVECGREMSERERDLGLACYNYTDPDGVDLCAQIHSYCAKYVLPRGWLPSNGLRIRCTAHIRSDEELVAGPLQ